MQNTYELPSGHIFSESAITPLTFYSESEMDAVDPGKIATDSTGKQFLIVEVRHISGKLYRIVMIPEEG